MNIGDPGPSDLPAKFKKARTALAVFTAAAERFDARSFGEAVPKLAEAFSSLADAVSAISATIDADERKATLLKKQLKKTLATTSSEFRRAVSKSSDAMMCLLAIAEKAVASQGA